MSVNRRALLQLDFLIIGGGEWYFYHDVAFFSHWVGRILSSSDSSIYFNSLGISGLACAYELSQYGHHVRIVEKAFGLGQVCV